MPNYNRQVLNALLPEGAAWEPKVDDDYDKLLDGVAENAGVVRTWARDLAYIRCPQMTPILSDLEKEYGIIPLTGQTEQERRDSVEVAKVSNDGDGTPEFLQEQLRNLGFDVYVYQNDPAVDPNSFLNEAFQMVAGNNFAIAGRDDAYASRIGGELLVNGDQYTVEPDYIMQASGDIAFAGDDDAIAGRFDNLRKIPIEYEVPTEPGYWSLIFFVGGAVTRDPITNAITGIESAEIPTNRRSEFRSTILRFKPLHSWAALIVIYS